MIVTQRRSLWEVARQVKCQIDAGEDADTLAKELLAWVLEVGDQPMPNPNRCLVEIPDTLATSAPRERGCPAWVLLGVKAVEARGVRGA